MKGDKKILVLAVLVLLLSVFFGTYAIYRNSVEGEGTVTAANWSIQIDGTDISSADFDFDASDITWTTLTGYNDTIAPGSEGYIDINVDADGSEVDVILTATLDTTNLPNGMTASIQGGNSKTISYSSTEGEMETTLRINIAWAGSDSDTSAKDGTDLAVEGTELSLPVTITAKQSVENHLQP
jgi:uncharacterized membrane protein